MLLRELVGRISDILTDPKVVKQFDSEKLSKTLQKLLIDLQELEWKGKVEGTTCTEDFFDEYTCQPGKELCKPEPEPLNQLNLYWVDKYRTPENICARCGHCRNSHLDQPEVKGGPPMSDRGWTTLPEGKCIFQGCDCVGFVEPDIEK